MSEGTQAWLDALGEGWSVGEGWMGAVGFHHAGGASFDVSEPSVEALPGEVELFARAANEAAEGQTGRMVFEVNREDSRVAVKARGMWETRVEPQQDERGAYVVVT